MLFSPVPLHHSSDSQKIVLIINTFFLQEGEEGEDEEGEEDDGEEGEEEEGEEEGEGDD